MLELYVLVLRAFWRVELRLSALSNKYIYPLSHLPSLRERFLKARRIMWKGSHKTNKQIHVSYSGVIMYIPQ